jgi:hypothetical protein
VAGISLVAARPEKPKSEFTSRVYPTDGAEQVSPTQIPNTPSLISLLSRVNDKKKICLSIGVETETRIKSYRREILQDQLRLKTRLERT